ncbi:MAG: hypothetical protein AAFR50_09490, partial [Pseudomonadota bacterium]
DEIRTAFYNKINRQHVVHTYVQSKPVNEVVYGMIVFDKATTATKISTFARDQSMGGVLNSRSWIG